MDYQQQNLNEKRRIPSILGTLISGLALIILIIAFLIIRDYILRRNQEKYFNEVELKFNELSNLTIKNTDIFSNNSIIEGIKIENESIKMLYIKISSRITKDILPAGCLFVDFRRYILKGYCSIMKKIEGISFQNNVTVFQKLYIDDFKTEIIKSITRYNKNNIKVSKSIVSKDSDYYYVAIIEDTNTIYHLLFKMENKEIDSNILDELFENVVEINN